MAEKAAPAAGSGSGAGVTAAVAALLANLGIAVAKFVGFLVAGASADPCGRPELVVVHPDDQAARARRGAAGTAAPRARRLGR